LRIIRLLSILKTILRYRLDQVLLENSKYRFILWLLPWHFLIRTKYTRAQRIVLTLEKLGPIFIKFGQTLSTRPDLLASDIANELTTLQDTCSPFSTDKAIAIIEKSLGGPLNNFFTNFEKTPLASASIAQVHTATTLNGEDIVIKVVRPNIAKKIKRDIKLLFLLVKLLNLHPDGKRLNLGELIKEFEGIIFNELNMLFEAANASKLRENFKNSELLYVPKVNWELTTREILVIERVYGTPINQIDKLKEKNIDLKRLSSLGVEIFFTQVFKHNFFHADMHPGNIFVSDSGQYIALDFGIMGSLSQNDLGYLAKNFLAFFNRDYKSVAEVHLESGWIPSHIDPIEFETAIRSVCEPIFNKPLKDISFGKVLLNLFQEAKKFDIQVQPQLFLLDKTLLNIEGLGRQLNDELDLWQTAKPVLEDIYKTEKKKKVKEQLQELTKLPKLTLEALTQLKQPQINNTKELSEISIQLKANNKQQKVIIWWLLGLSLFSIYLVLKFIKI
jgi:ubiquinone biosynthesis protein